MKKPLLLPLILLVTQSYLSSQVDPDLQEAFQNILDQDRVQYGYNGISAALIYPDGCTWSGISGSSTGEDTIDTETIFQAGLCTQFFTATLILMLEEAGKLSIDDPISNYLNPITYVDSSITVRQLLNHSSGLEWLYDIPDLEELYQNPTMFWNPDSLINLYIKPAPFLPGEKFYASELNYFLLGKIIETVSGNPFHVELRKSILDPLGLVNTYFPPYEEIQGKLAIGKNIFTRELYLDDLTGIFSLWWAQLALVSTATDIMKFMRTLFEGEIISQNSLSMMLDTITIPEGEFGEWKGMGLGIGFLEYKGTAFNGQTGFVLHRTRAYYSPELKMGVATFITELNGTDAFYKIVDVMLESLEFCETTSTIQTDLSQEINIFPNPSNGEIVIDPGADFDRPWKLKIYNVFGQLIMQSKNNYGSYKLEGNQLGLGQFFVDISIDDPSYGSVVRKLIVNP